MTKSNKNENVVDLHKVGKKEWQKPQMTQLEIKKTEAKHLSWHNDGGWPFINS